jgi:hypothetical protein
MKGLRDLGTTEPTMDNALAVSGDRPRHPGGGKSWSAPLVPERIDGKLGLAAVDFAGAARMVAACDGENSRDALQLRGEFGRIRMLQGRLDEAERLLSTVYRASNLQCPDCARLVVNYAAVLHRLGRDGEAIAVLDCIEPVLEKHPDTLGVEATDAMKLRKMIAADM